MPGFRKKKRRGNRKLNRARALALGTHTGREVTTMPQGSEKPTQKHVEREAPKPRRTETKRRDEFRLSNADARRFDDVVKLESQSQSSCFVIGQPRTGSVG
jgi:hypothetical protein